MERREVVHRRGTGRGGWEEEKAVELEDDVVVDEAVAVQRVFGGVAAWLVSKAYCMR